ncbi:CheY-like chemotaxis protein [Novosphingobium sp. PhB57]|uniref:response regulator n=1 Tax=Novosphingobium sp. PhB57 TaxID=2485107 RepID=UPI001053CFF8|nr:response regulator [Novosphingobium sp. PhB57]TCU51849.1 CheY-like chemotaxis protein [Novosphingobium sp. PhB57]
MVHKDFHGRHILVVEDEYLIADDVRMALEEAGAEVLGPVASIKDAEELISSSAMIDAALLDVNVRGEQIFAVADQLADRGVPFVFATGYDQASIPDRYRDRPCLEKPIRARQIASILSPLLRIT